MQTTTERRASMLYMREAGAQAFRNGDGVESLSPVVSAWRADAWRAGWRAAQRKAEREAAKGAGAYKDKTERDYVNNVVDV